MNKIERDAALIRDLGGPTKVAAAIGPDAQISVQRVQNWIKRGIPSEIKVTYPHLFMPELAQPTSAPPAVTDSIVQAAANV